MRVRGQGIVLSAVLVFVATWMTSNAYAGVYAVEQCTNNFPASASYYYNESSTPTRFSFSESCGDASLRYMQTITTGNGSNIPQDRTAYTAFYAPDGSGFISGQFKYNMRSMNGVNTRVVANDPGGTNTVELKSATMGAAPITGTHYWSLPTGQKRSTFRGIARCNSNPCSNPATGRPFYQLGHILLRINDHTPPTVSIAGGSMFSNRVHGGVETLQVNAADWQGGVRRLHVRVNGQTVATENVAGCWVNSTANVAVFTHNPCPSTANHTFSINTNASPWVKDGFPNDVKVCAEDLATTGAANTTCTASRVVLVGGNGIHATLYTGNPSAGGEYLAEEWLQKGTKNTRREDLDEIATRQTKPCDNGVGGVCVDLRTEERYEDGSAGDWELEFYSDQNDPAIDLISELSEALHEDHGSVVQTGSLSAVKASWQTAPPGAGSSYRLYRQSSTPVIDDITTPTVNELVVETATGLPIVERRYINGTLEEATYFTYTSTENPPNTLSEADFQKPPSPGVENTSITGVDPEPVGPIGTADPGEGDGVSADDEAVRFRTSVGLDVTPSALVAAESSPVADEAIAEFGVPLTSSELADMNERMELQEKLQDVMEYAENEAPSTFGGVWMDQEDGGVAKVGFTSGAAGHQDDLEDLVESEQIEAVTVEHSLSDLVDLQEELSEDLDALRDDDIDVQSVSLDVSENEVAVGVDGLNGAAASTIEGYGDGAVATEEEPPNSAMMQLQNATSPAGANSQGFKTGFLYSKRRVSSSNTPLHPGSYIIRRNGGSCSSGFALTRKIGGKRRYYIATASHCVRGRWYHNGKNKYATGGLIGRVGKNFDLLKRDIMLIPTKRKRVTSLLMRHPIGPDLKRIDRVMGNPGATLWASVKLTDGKVICRVGYRKVKRSCGKVTKPVVNGVKLKGREQISINGLVETDVFARMGDSGGPFFQARTALGTFTGGQLNPSCRDAGTETLQFLNCPFDSTWFAPIDFAMKKFDLDLVLTR